MSLLFSVLCQQRIRLKNILICKFTTLHYLLQIHIQIIFSYGMPLIENAIVQGMVGVLGFLICEIKQINPQDDISTIDVYVRNYKKYQGYFKYPLLSVSELRTLPQLNKHYLLFIVIISIYLKETYIDILLELGYYLEKRVMLRRFNLHELN